jgi:hypothetical protein
VASGTITAAAPGRTGAGRRYSIVSWLVVTGYLVAAVALMWRFWADPGGRVTAGDPNAEDADLFTWSLRYAAAAGAHGHLPALVTTALNAPHGVNLMWNTTILLPSLLLAPLTLTAGPVVGLTVLLTLSYAGSAASLFLVLRRWGASTAGAAIGGAIYGFSPALVDSGISHDDLVIAVTPPLIIDAVLRIVTRRGSPVRNGAWLGLLVVAQLFTEEELLVDTALATVIILVVGAARRRAWREGRAIPRSVIRGGAAATVVTLVLGGYGLWGPVPRSAHRARQSLARRAIHQQPGWPGDPAGHIAFPHPGERGKRGVGGYWAVGVPVLSRLSAPGRCDCRGHPVLA